MSFSTGIQNPPAPPFFKGGKEVLSPTLTKGGQGGIRSPQTRDYYCQATPVKSSSSRPSLNASAARFRDKAIIEEPRSAFIERLVRGLFETPAGEAPPIPDLKIRAEVQLPLQADLPTGQAGLSQSPFQLKFVAEVGEGGEIQTVRLVSKPPAGPIPLKPWLKPFINIPIIGPLVSVRAQSVEMAPNRAVLVRAKYLFFDLVVDKGKMIFDASGISARDFEKRGFAVYRIPEQLHQLVGMVLAGREGGNPPSPPFSKGGKTGPQRADQPSPAKTKGKPSSAFLAMAPNWKEANIEITGDFSNRVIEVDLEEDLAKRMDPQKARRLRLTFAGKVPPGGHRLTVRGGFVSPTVEIVGLKTIEYVHPDRVIRASDTASQPTPFVAQVSLNPADSGEIRASFSWNHPDGFKLEEISRTSGKILSRLELPQGGEVKEFTVRLNGPTPEVSIKRLRTQAIQYQGHGISLRSSARQRMFTEAHGWVDEIPPGAGIADLSFQIVRGKPRFEGTITSHMDAEVSYHLSNDSAGGLGKIQFRPLAGVAPLTIGPDEKNPNHTRISFTNARLYAHLPRLGLRVNQKSHEGFLSVKIAEADLDVVGTVHVVPERREMEILAEHPGGAIFSTRQASLRLQRKEGEEGTDLSFDISNARFMGHRLRIQPSEDGSMELMEAFFDHLSISGELIGRAVIPIPNSSLGIPFRIRQTVLNGRRTNVPARMPVQMTVESVGEQPTDSVDGYVVKNISIDAEESAPTLLPREAAACGFDRQRFRFQLETLEVQGDQKPRLRFRNIGDQLQVNLIEELTGSCVSVGMKKVP